jgi:hypothetical protein
MKDATPNVSIKRSVVTAKLAKSLNPAKELLKGPLTLAMGRWPTLKERFESFDHQTRNGHHREPIWFRLGRVKVPVDESPLDGLSDPCLFRR